MMGEIRTAVYPAPTVCRHEILRYAGTREADAATGVLIDECEALVRGQLSYRVAYAEFSIRATDAGLDLGFAVTDSRDLARALWGCERIVLFGATVGLALDRLVARYTALSPAKGLILDAIGTAHAEALCDLFCAELAEKYAKEGRRLRPRFSPGYGDLPLEMQKSVASALNLSRTVGITLNESLLMLPRKSVTAIVGILSEKESL